MCTATRTISYSLVGPSVFFIFSLGLNFVCLCGFNVNATNRNSYLNIICIKLVTQVIKKKQNSDFLVEVFRFNYQKPCY